MLDQGLLFQKINLRLKLHELNLKKKDFLKNKIILLYGENQDLIKDINEQIINKFSEKKEISKNFFEDDILKNPENIINYYLNGSLFDNNAEVYLDYLHNDHRLAS